MSVPILGALSVQWGTACWAPVQTPLQARTLQKIVLYSFKSYKGGSQNFEIESRDPNPRPF